MANQEFFGQRGHQTDTHPANAMDFILSQFAGKIQTCTVVEIVSVTNSGGISPVGYVDVRPMVNQIDGQGRPTPHGVIYNVPYFRIQGGTDAIIIDPKKGDKGMCAFASRDISAVKKSKRSGNPGSLRRFDMADGLYLGGFLNGTPVQYIAFTAGGVTITSPSKVTINAPEIDFN